MNTCFDTRGSFEHLSRANARAPIRRFAPVYEGAR